MKSRMKTLKGSKNLQQLILLGILILLIMAMSLMSDKFFTVINLTNLLRQQVMVAIVAAGATFVMITGGLDISVGSNIAFTGVMYALCVQQGVPIFLAGVIAVLMGGIVGVINAGMIVGAKLNHVIATLGSMYAIRGVAYIVAGGQAITNGLPKNFMELGRGYVFGVIPIPVIIMIFVYIIAHIVLTRTLLGKYTYAIGGNIETARLSGLPVKKVIFSLYMITGLLTGLAGVIMSSRLNSGNPQIGQGFEFDVIVAVFLGGVSTKGGEGTIIGTLIGAIIVGVLSNGLNLLGVDAFYQYIVKGIILVLAVLVDQTVRRKS